MDHANAPLLTQRHGDHVALLRLNRPDRLNAVSQALYDALHRELESLAVDEAVRAVVLTGNGRAFCVGADLKAHGTSEPTAEDRTRYVKTGQAAYRALQSLPQPTVAAVNGHAIGAGLELALSCDLVVMSDDAKLRLPELALGTFVGGGTVYTLAQRVGLARAKELILLGDFFGARDPVADGLANRIAATDDVLDSALKLAQQLASKAPVSMRLAKELLNSSQRLDYEEALRREGEALAQCMATRDWREGIDAFHAKREPRFIGE